MKQVVLNGVTFTKASEIAKKFNYTSDYVGQLCRSGKVDAQLVGRSWYVSEDSITSHKKKRYQKDPAKTKVRAITPKPVQDNKNRLDEKTLDDKVDIKTDEKTYQVSVRTNVTKKAVLPLTRKNDDKHFEDRIQWKKETVKPTVYEVDQENLIPELKKPKKTEKSVKLPVDPAESKKVLIETEGSTEARLKPTKMPSVSLNGTLKIESYDVELANNTLENKANKVHSQNPVQLKNSEGIITMKRAEKPAKPVFTPKAVTENIESVTDSIQEDKESSFEAKLAELDTADEIVESELDINSAEEIVPEASWVSYATLVIWVLIFLTPVFILGMEQVVVGTQNSMSESFMFSVSALTNFALF